MTPAPGPRYNLPMLHNPYRRFRDRHGLTWADLGQQLGISTTYARHLGNGHVTRVSDLRKRDFESRTGGALKAATLRRWERQNDTL